MEARGSLPLAHAAAAAAHRAGVETVFGADGPKLRRYQFAACGILQALKSYGC